MMIVIEADKRGGLPLVYAVTGKREDVIKSVQEYSVEFMILDVKGERDITQQSFYRDKKMSAERQIIGC